MGKVTFSFCRLQRGPKHAREPLYSKGAVIVWWLQWTSAQKSVSNCLKELSPSYTVTIHHHSSRFETDGKIGIRRDGKKEIPASIRCLTMLLRCLRDSSTDPQRFMTAALRFTTVELQMLTMPPRFDTVLVRFKPVALR